MLRATAPRHGAPAADDVLESPSGAPSTPPPPSPSPSPSPAFPLQLILEAGLPGLIGLVLLLVLLCYCIKRWRRQRRINRIWQQHINGTGEANYGGGPPLTTGFLDAPSCQ